MPKQLWQLNDRELGMLTGVEHVFEHPKHGELTLEYLRALEAENTKLRKYLKALSTDVSGCVLALDSLPTMPASYDRGKAIARIANLLEMSKDRARHFGLGINLKTGKKRRG